MQEEYRYQSISERVFEELDVTKVELARYKARYGTLTDTPVKPPDIDREAYCLAHWMPEPCLFCPDEDDLTKGVEK